MGDREATEHGDDRASFGSGEAVKPAVPATAYRFGRHTLDLVAGCLRDGGREIKLRPKAFAMLCYFVRNAGRLLSKDELMQAGWPNVIVTDDSLVQCVREIRRALGDEDELCIKTVPRRGYLFVAAVSPTAVRAPALSIVVLPFALPGGDPREDDVASALTDDLTTYLARFPWTVVTARSTARRFMGDGADVRALGHALNVRHVLMGSVRRDGGRVRIAVRLDDAETGSQLWADIFDIAQADLADAPAMLDVITMRIGAMSHIELIVAASARALREHLDSRDANDPAIPGRAALAGSPSPESVVEAKRFFERAAHPGSNAIR